MPDAPRRNIHAVGLVVERTGLLVMGQSGSGKTTLALALIAHAVAQGRFARLVADDQVLLRVVDGRLLADAPAAISGLAEARGWRPSPLPFLTATVVDLVVVLQDPSEPGERYASDRMLTVEGVALPQLRLPARSVAGGVTALSARLALPPFHPDPDPPHAAAI